MGSVITFKFNDAIELPVYRSSAYQPADGYDWECLTSKTSFEPTDTPESIAVKTRALIARVLVDLNVILRRTPVANLALVVLEGWWMRTTVVDKDLLIDATYALVPKELMEPGNVAN